MLSGRRLAIVLGTGLVAGLALCLVAGQGLPGDPSRRSVPAVPRPSALPSESAAVAALRSWDRRRADAWADGDADALRALYVTGSTAGAADVRLLRRWTARGLRVRGMTEQVLAVRVLESRPSRVRLVVTGRLSGGSAGAPGAAGVRLPRGSVATRAVVLRRTSGAGAWQVVSVRQPVPRPPPT